MSFDDIFNKFNPIFVLIVNTKRPYVAILPK